MNEINISIGMLSDGTSVSRDLKRLPHLLIAGGQKNEARTYLTALLIEAVKDISPSDIRVLALHLDNSVNALPHLLTPVITDEKEAEAALLWLQGEVDRRYALFTEAGTYNIDKYNEKAESKLFHIACAIGELEKLTKRAKESTAMLAAKARAAGIYLIACTEKPEAKVITGIIKANIPSRIAFKTETKAESRVILDCTGAEKLADNELLFLPVGQNVPEKLAFSLPTAEELESTVSELAGIYPRAEFEAFTEKAQKAPSLTVQALEIALRYGGITAALLQRALHIGYAKAAKLIDEMEKAGYIGEFNGSKPRSVLLTNTELEKLIKELREI